MIFKFLPIVIKQSCEHDVDISRYFKKLISILEKYIWSQLYLVNVILEPPPADQGGSDRIGNYVSQSPFYL